VRPDKKAATLKGARIKGRGVTAWGPKFHDQERKWGKQKGRREKKEKKKTKNMTKNKGGKLGGEVGGGLPASEGLGTFHLWWLGKKAVSWRKKRGLSGVQGREVGRCLSAGGGAWGAGKTRPVGGGQYAH